MTVWALLSNQAIKISTVERGKDHSISAQSTPDDRQAHRTSSYPRKTDRGDSGNSPVGFPDGYFPSQSADLAQSYIIGHLNETLPTSRDGAQY